MGTLFDSSGGGSNVDNNALGIGHLAVTLLWYTRLPGAWTMGYERHEEEHNEETRPLTRLMKESREDRFVL
jgi:hypothetical protein